MELYFKIRAFMDIVALSVLGIFILLFLIFIIWSYFDNKKDKKITKYMESNGYKRYLRDVASVGNKAWWAWRKDNVSVDEDVLYKMSLRKVKKTYK